MTTQILRRIRAIRHRRLPWYAWGRRVMILVAREDGRAFDGVPRPRDLWFRHEDDGRITTTRDYADVRARNDGLWRIFDSQSDGHEVVIGWYPGPDGDGRLRPSSIDGRAEQALFRRWLIWDGWIKAEWFGLRRWLYYRALHAVVHEKVPFTCQQVPGKFSGGYDHWHCRLRRGHKGKHCFRGSVWADGGKVEHDPIVTGASR